MMTVVAVVVVDWWLLLLLLLLVMIVALVGRAWVGVVRANILSRHCDHSVMILR